MNQAMRAQYASYAKQLYKMLIQASSASYQSNEVACTWAVSRIRSEFRKHKDESNPQRIENLLQRAHLVLLAVAADDA
ncbi:uncharacterized protein ACA1_033470 [Acanthamoeba castellanii str. Neff]|jgi:hypothetical protein|uniref:Complex 1 LYR protein domain-containing protein n=1 Tax=Acanthamoeba castellanii (strain ATCC 30010 / Neff) TaxID=1257118 RepID=L8GH88_ACACF|nr:uncharacterized protein ACA1_033470 [Acanthamoeba castellanii str. Neff]ELR12199.1 hypothetical protein ACA1_033470 [Acanthamoeba castellanii str. Neff]